MTVAPSTSRRLFAEGLGTALLVVTVVGSGIMAERLSHDVGFQLLANTLPTVAILFVMISLLEPISGAHFNPAVSLVMALKREIGWTQFLGYLIVQLIGGVVGTLLAHAMFEMPLWQVSTHARTGASQWLAETVATFGLLLTILVGRVYRVSAVPALVAAYIAAAYWFTASTSFANPAVTLARARTGSFSGIAPADVPDFVLAQIAGALAAAIITRWLVPARRQLEPEVGHGRSQHV